MKKKMMVLALSVLVAAGAGLASAEERAPSASYKDSLIRAGEPVEMRDGRRHPVDNPKFIPSQTAPVRAGHLKEKPEGTPEGAKPEGVPPEDLNVGKQPSKVYGHGPQMRPGEGPAMGRGYGMHHPDGSKFEKKDLKDGPKFDKKDKKDGDRKSVV